MPKITLYKIVKGDTLFAIARRFGMTAADLKKLNSLTSDSLSIGQVLKVYGDAVPFTPPTPEGKVPPIPPNAPPSTPSVNGDFRAVRNAVAVNVQNMGNYSRFTLSLPNPQGGTITAQLRDNNTQSRYMVYPNGIFYPGQHLPNLPFELVKSVGLTDVQARALQFVSRNEGKFDAINSYDKGVFSYGFIQFVGASEHGSSLNRLLESMKLYAPSLFDKYFRRAGIDTEGGIVTVLNENGTKLKGDDAWLFIQKTIALYAPFIQAAYEPLLLKEQLRCANNMYVQTAMNLKVPLSINGIPLVVPQISMILSSEAALTMLIDLCVNQGSGGLTRVLQTAIPPVAQKYRLLTLSNLRSINEYELLNNIVATATDSRVKDRTQLVLNSSLSFDKV
jgi:LysM domain